MVGAYVRARLAEQCWSVAFLVGYLALFQALVVGAPPAAALRIAVGLGLLLVGLTCFLEGLWLGLMPLGEQVGLQLPRRTGVAVIAAFGLLLGLGSTLAEPAIAALRVAGLNVTAWDAPLLFRLLELDTEKLVAAIGIGVGVAVAAGMIRFAFGLSIKPFVYVLVPVLLGVSAWCARDANLGALLGLAWDAGAVTTGAVTVPLVLALGIGVSRAAGRQEGAGGGFGVIMLASALPVLAVLLLGMTLNASTPRATAETAFFAPAHRAEALRLFPDDDALVRHAFRRGSAEGRRAFFGDETAHAQAIRALADPAMRRLRLGDLSLAVWAAQRASDWERALLPSGAALDAIAREDSRLPLAGVLGRESLVAARAVVPLSALLLVALMLFLRVRPRHGDETALGIGLALVGMTLLTAGIRLGLVPLGDEVGRPLPAVMHGEAMERGRVRIEPFDPSAVFTAYGEDGTPAPHFFLRDGDGRLRPEPFDPTRLDAESGRYEHVLRRPPAFALRWAAAGAALVLLFAFGLGYGTTLAEPALAALGRTVEELTVGTVRRAGFVRAVSVGVGLGLVAGVGRMLFGIPNLWLLVPPYLLLLPLTYGSGEDFVGMAWDSGGVTTGIVTVPLVLAMGQSIGGELGVVDRFGILAMASVYPIVSVLVYGLILRARQRRSLNIAAGEGGSGG